jgi:hypothetical protein
MNLVTQGRPARARGAEAIAELEHVHADALEG